MAKYLVSILQSEKKHAGSKAQDDIQFFLKKAGFLNIYIDGEMFKLEKIMFLSSLLKKKLSFLKKKDILVVQYPFYLGRFGENVFKRNLATLTCKKIVIIHDLISLRQETLKESVGYTSSKNEIALLNQFDLVVTHSKKMSEWIKEKGFSGKTKELGLFDYEMDNQVSVSTKTENNTVVFAGNLEKASFLQKLDPKDYFVNLYGIGYKENNNKRIMYNGSFAPEDLPSHIKGNWGLVWEGDSLISSSEYMKYNLPHKISLFMALGLPVIVWKESVVAEIVENKGLGIVLDSLTDLNRQLNQVSIEEYEQYKKNVLSMGDKLRSGYFVLNAVSHL